MAFPEIERSESANVPIVGSNDAAVIAAALDVAPASEGEQAGPPAVGPSREARIMIVDDEIVNIKVVRRFLALEGYENFVTTTEPLEAMDVVVREHPDVILLDIMMPGMSGLEILEQIRNDPQVAHTPVIILTAATNQETKQQALNLGATDFLAKPLDVNELIPRVHNALVVKDYQDHLKTYAQNLENEVRKRTAELEQSRIEIVRCLGRAAEYRDNETGWHVIRVGRYVGIIASELGMDDATADLLELASTLHDVGKIGIADSVLLKPGKLTPEEFDIMKTHCALGKNVFGQMPDDDWRLVKCHTQIGSKILAGTTSLLLPLAASIALTHHEKWDGSGYPMALAGESIPFEGRITAVADVFDALSSKRPYKPAFPLDKCLDIMRQERGAHFDPIILDAFFAKEDDIVKIQMEFADSQ